MTILDSAPVETTGRIVAHHRGRYVVQTGQSHRDAIVSGRFMHHVADPIDLPAVGDFVVLAAAATEGTSRIESVFPRRSAFIRKAAGDSTTAQVIAANVDLALIATALPHDLNPRRLDRYLSLAWESGAVPIVVLTKSDLVDDVEFAVAEVSRIAVGVDVIVISSLTMTGLPTLAARIEPGLTAVLLGSSGVGKSSLVNALLGAERQRTSAVRDDGSGRHTTTHRELLELPNGGFLIDTHGLREVGLWSSIAGLEQSFGDIEGLSSSCRFADCAHETEPDCAVLEAVAAGTLDAGRLESWRALRRELAFLERKQDAALAAEAKRFAKSLDRLGRARLREKYD
jgi:ribosome biogenesis GTPase